MKFLGSRITLSTAFLYIFFVAIVAYVFYGRLLEKPSIQVDHFVAGAGNLSLCLSLPLVILLSIIPLKFWKMPERRIDIIPYGAALILPLLVFTAMLFGVERKAPQFNEETYQTIVVAYDDGQVITTQQALDLLGPPLSQEQIDGRDIWSYTYMPSTGIGWHKRILIFGRDGLMIGYNNINEP